MPTHALEWVSERGDVMKTTSFLVLGLLVAVSLQAQTRNFSGDWVLDRYKSDSALDAVLAGAGKLQKGRNQMLQRHLADVLVLLASEAARIEIEHTKKDITIFDRGGNVNIYYIDGKKHVREEPHLGSMQTVTQWQGNELVVESKSKEAGKGVQTFSMVGNQLVIKVRIDAKTFENEVIADFYYNRVE